MFHCQIVARQQCSNRTIEQLINLKLTQYLHNLEKLFFFLTILFLPTQLGKHFWPEFSSVYSLRIDYLSPTIYFWDLLVLFLLLVHLLKLQFTTSPLKINKTAGVILLLFLLTQFASIFSAVNPGASLVRLKEYFIVGLFALYIASSNFEIIRKPLITGLLIAVVFSCFLGISQFLTGGSLGLWVLGEREFSIATPLISKFNFYERIFLRPYATFSHPNLFSGFLIAALPILLAGLSSSLRGFKVMLTLLLSSTVFITFSRPGFILVSIYFTVLFKRFWKLLLLLAVVIAPIIMVRFVSIFTYDTLAVLRRQELSEFALKIFFLHPFLGVGLNNFINSLASTEVLVGTSRFLQPVHNIFLLSLSETGLFGILGFLTLLGSAAWFNLRRPNPLSAGLLTSLLIIIFLGLFDHYFLTLPQGQRLLFLIAGLSLMGDRKFKT